MRRFKTSFILFFILIIVALYSYFIEFKRANKIKEKQMFSEQVLPLKVDAVSELVIVNEDTKIDLNLINNKWEITDPIKWPADLSLINESLNKLTQNSILIKSDPSADDLNSFGIKETNKLNVTLKNKNEFTLSFGDKSPVSNERYAYINAKAKKIVLVKEELFTSFNKKVADFRDKAIFRNLNISKLDFTKFSFSKENDLWLANNKDIVLDQNVVSKFATDISDLKAKSFVFNKEQSDYLISNAWKLYKLIFSGLKITSSELVYDFYTSTKDGKKYFAYKTSDGKFSQIFELENLDLFSKKLYEFRKKDIFSSVLKDVNSIEIINDSSLIVLNKNNENDWTANNGLVLDKVKVNSFIDSVKSTQVVNFIDKQKIKNYGLEKAKKTLIFKNELDKIILKIDFGKTKDNLIAVLYDDHIYEINKDILDKLTIDAFSNN